MRHSFCILGISAMCVLPASGQTGVLVPNMLNCDLHMQSFIDELGVTGGVIAVGWQGRMIYNRAFGHADLAGNEPMHPSHLFRIASLSKAITSAAIFTLVEAGELQLTDVVFGPQGLLHDHPYIGGVDYGDQRLEEITVLHLLQHTAGWDRDLNCFPEPTPPYTFQWDGCDPIVAPLFVTQVLGESNPVSENALIRFLMERGLDHDPGTTYAYSNIGYLVLGEVIEHLTGMAYADYVQSAVFDPLGICDIHLGCNLITDKLEREVEYKLAGYPHLPSCYGTGEMVPLEYGGLNVEAMDAHGGWVATASEMLKLIMGLDGFTSRPDLLQPATIAAMATPSNANPNYACGWQVTPDKWWHTGSLPGNSTDMVRQSNGYSWVLLLNGEAYPAAGDALWNAIHDTGVQCGNTTGGFPGHDLLDMPSSNANGLSVTPTGPTTMEIACIPGDGDARVMVIRESGSMPAYPEEGTEYLPSTEFTAGDDLGQGNYVVSTGPATAVSVTGLQMGMDYTVSVFEYNERPATGQHPVYKFCGRSDVGVALPVGVAQLAGAEGGFQTWASEGRLSVRLHHMQGEARLQVRNAAGSLVTDHAVMPGTSTVDLGAHASGMYFVSLLRTGAPPLTQRVGLVR